MPPPSAKPSLSTENPPKFAADADAVLGELRTALGAVLAEIVPPVRREPELRAALDLDKKLSWSVFNATVAADSRSIAPLLPGRRAMQRFFDAAGRHGVRSQTLDRASEAFAQFESIVVRHARTRQDFDAMVADIAVADESSRTTVSRQRVAAFRANAVLWGRQAKVVLASTLLHPSRTPGLFDNVLIRGLFGLHRTRRDAALYSVMQPRRQPAAGDPLVPGSVEPVDAREQGPDAVGLMRDFCSQPLPRFEPNVAADGRRCFAAVSRDVGKAAAIDLVLGHVTYACAVPPGSKPDAQTVISYALALPTELFIRDVLVHRSLWDERLPELRVYAPPMDGSPDVHEIDRLPVHDSVECLGLGMQRAWTLHVPQYQEILAFTAARFGFAPEEFRVFRCIIEHPVLHTWIRLVFR